MSPRCLSDSGLVLSLLVGALGASTAGAQCESEKFVSPLPKDNGQFGTVALDGSWLAVGEWSFSRYAGAVHVYDQATGALQATLEASDAAAFAYLGSSVALRDGLVATGAVKASGVGRAYLFDAEQASELAAFDPIGVLGAKADFGTSIDLDGRHVAVGAPGNHFLLAPDDGTVHVFDQASGAALYRLEAPEPSGSAWMGVHSQFGSSLALDGGLLLVGAPFAGDWGGAYVYDAASGALLHELQQPPTANTVLGWMVELVGTRAYVSALGTTVNAVSVFDAATGAHLFDVTHPDSPSAVGFGGSVGGNERWFAVGQAGANPSFFEARVHLYDAGTGDWLGQLAGFPAQPMSQFGISLAVFGERLAVGDTADNSLAPGAGAAYLFDPATCR